MEKGPNTPIQENYTEAEIDKSINDYNKVAEAYKADIETKLLQSSATYDEAMIWYYSTDPVNERLYLDILKSTMFPNDQKLAQDTTLRIFLKPFLLLSAGQIAISSFSGKNRSFNFSDLNNKEILNDYCNMVDDIKVPDTENELSGLITTTHIYAESIDLLDSLRQMGGGNLSEELLPDIGIVAKTTMKLLEKSLKACANDVSLGNYKFLDLAMTANMEYSSHLFAYAVINDGELRKQSQKKAIENLVSAIKTYYIDNTNLDLSISNNKGPLHEALWMLDTSFLFINSEGFLRDAYVSPSLPRMDKPVIGRPAVNRGIDMSISLKTNDLLGIRDTHYVQLKSRANKLGKYHPSITVLGEENFTESINNLDKKISLYYSWIENDMDESTTEKLKELVLGSAKNYVDKLESEMPYTLKDRVIKRLGRLSLYSHGFTDPVLDLIVEKIRPMVTV